MAIIDACNVLHSAGNRGIAVSGSQKKTPNAIGLLVLVHELISNDFDVLALLRQSYTYEDVVENSFIIQRLKSLGFVRVIQYTETPHDDKEILKTAASTGGFIISNDTFRDYALMNGTPEAVLDLLRRRLVQYSVQKVDVESIGGRERLAKKENQLFTGIDFRLQPPEGSMFVSEDDLYFPEAHRQRSLFNEKRMAFALDEISLIFDFLHQRQCIYMGLRPPTLPFFNSKFQELPYKFDGFKEMQKRQQEALMSSDDEELLSVIESRLKNFTRRIDLNDPKIPSEVKSLRIQKAALTTYGKMPSLRSVVRKLGEEN